MESRRPIAAGRPRRDLAVLVFEFPKLSETFVLHDLLALEAAGARLELFAVRRPETDVAHEALDRLKANVRYLPELDGRQRRLALRATRALLLARDPRRHLRALARIYSSPDYSKTRLAQALLLAAELERIGSPPLYIHFAHKAGTVGRFAALLLGAPYAISAHAVDVWTPPAKELRLKVRDAETVLCCYEEARAYVDRLGRHQTPVALVHHGVHLPPPRSREESSPPVVLGVGRLVEKKGYATLLRSAAMLRERGVDFRVRIAGEGPEWPSLQRLVNELELGEIVRFLGPLTDAEVDREYMSASVFALPCQRMPDGNRDGMPNTLLEAMARELPVISTQLPSVAEAVEDGSHGMLVPERDPEALAGALERLLGDRDLRVRLGQAARERVSERFDRRACAPRVFDALASAGMFGEGR